MEDEWQRWQTFVLVAFLKPAEQFLPPSGCSQVGLIQLLSDRWLVGNALALVIWIRERRLLRGVVNMRDGKCASALDYKINGECLIKV